jgi:hypothetical protein
MIAEVKGMRIVLTLLLWVPISVSASEIDDRKVLSEQIFAEAQYNVGVMYEKGKGTPLDYPSAYMWWNLAAASGDENGQRNSGKVAGMMTPAVIGAGSWAGL